MTGNYSLIFKKESDRSPVVVEEFIDGSVSNDSESIHDMNYRVSPDKKNNFSSCYK